MSDYMTEMYQEALSALPAAPMPGVKAIVRLLVWQDGEARTNFGSAYAIHRTANDMYVAVGCGSFVGGNHASRDAAQAAAQADFEARILSSLEVPAHPEGVKDHG